MGRRILRPELRRLGRVLRRTVECIVPGERASMDSGDRIEKRYRSVALPLIGAGSGGGDPAKVQSLIEVELANCHFDGEVRIVRFAKDVKKTR